MADTACRRRPYHSGRSISTCASAGCRAATRSSRSACKVFDTLLVLVDNAGRLVTKQELLDTVWPGTAVEENNLNHNVSVLRKALGEKATGQQYIETVPRVGYRFAAPVDRRRHAAPASVRLSREGAPGAPLLHDQRRRPARLCEHRPWTAAREGIELADASRLRMGQPDLAPLVFGALASPPPRPLRRARQRHVSAGRGRCELRHVGPRPRNRRRCGRPRSVSAARNLPRRRHRHRVCGEASRARHAPGPLRRLRRRRQPRRHAADH